MVVIIIIEALQEMEVKIEPIGKKLKVSSKSSSKKEDVEAKWFPQVQKLREFKISGSIGADGQRDTLTYASLVFQMQRGRDEGYSYKEIQGTVIKAIKPGNNLRNYRESRVELRERALLQILRSNFKEKDSTQVFHDLSNAAQLTSDSEMDFCSRVMEFT